MLFIVGQKLLLTFTYYIDYIILIDYIIYYIDYIMLIGTDAK